MISEVTRQALTKEFGEDVTRQATEHAEWEHHKGYVQSESQAAYRNAACYADRCGHAAWQCRRPTHGPERMWLDQGKRAEDREKVEADPPQRWEDTASQAGGFAEYLRRVGLGPFGNPVTGIKAALEYERDAFDACGCEPWRSSECSHPLVEGYTALFRPRPTGVRRPGVAADTADRRWNR